MRRSFSFPGHPARGSALLIVLAVLLLLTTLTVAFLSRATFERQLSNASYSQGKVDMAGQAAVAAIIADLQTEIVAGSNTGAGTSIPQLANGFYYPTAPATVIPALAVPGYTSASIVGTGMEDLLKVSKSGQTFYPSGGNYTGTPSSRASGVNTYANPSLNGRTVTAVRWNKPLLLARNTPTSTTDYTPVTTFPIPDWIYVARDGSNPTGTGLNNSFIYSPSVSPTATPTPGTFGTNAITQRYAYAIYDEGSTLDLNVAGSPSGTTTLSYSALQPYKNALPYADLTQLPGIGSGSSTLTLVNQAAFVNAIVGWRNFSSTIAGASSKFPNTYAFPTSGTGTAAFDRLVSFNPSGFLTVGSTVPLTPSTPAKSPPLLSYGPNATSSNGVQDQGDNAFASRQELLQFMLVGLGQNSTFIGKVPLATLVNLMPYLGTFSRDISQPSYAPNPTRPVITGTYTIGGNDGYGGDASINPPFLSVTAATGGWTRNDGSIATAGEPLVKKKFALNRLAWITYLGPSDGRSSVSAGTNPSSTANTGTTTANADYDLYQLENNYNIPISFLQQGTATNIQNYFGLVWNSSGYWTYQPTSGATTKILTLSQVNALNREPNFVELLKASILAGATGKDFPTDISDINQNYRYTSVDCSILQMAANIIDQSTCDGYPTQIQFTNGAGITYQIYGIKNLPYFYRVRPSCLTTTLPTVSGNTAIYPTNTTGQPVAANNNWTGTVTSSGSFTVLQEPEVWNPHAWNPGDTTTFGEGNPRPTQFYLSAASTGSYTITPLARSNAFSSGTATPTQYSLTGTLSFQMPVSSSGAALYREPTLLISPNVPLGSNLQLVGSTAVQAYGLPYAYGSNGNNGPQYPSSFTNTLTTSPTTTQTNPFLGFYEGAGQLIWPTGTVTGQTLFVANQAQINGQGIQSSYTLSCAAPSAFGGNIPYDIKIGYTLCSSSVAASGSITFSAGLTDYEKYPAGLGGDPRNNADSSMLDMYCPGYDMGGYLDHMISSEVVYDVFDPRTGRFGMINWNGALNQAGSGGQMFMFPPRYGQNGPSTRWVSRYQNMLESDRPDNYIGYGSSGDQFPNSNGTYPDATYPPNNADGWCWASQTQYSGLWYGGTFGPSLYHGMFEQNNMNIEDCDNTYVNPQQFTGPQSSNAPQWYADPDGVVRRGEGGYVIAQLPQSTSSNTASGTTTLGLPMATAVGYVTVGTTSLTGTPITTGTATAGSNAPPYVNVTATSVATDMTSFSSYSGSNFSVNTGSILSRPLILNRPFRTVGELGYAFSGTPWKNLDLMCQESGCTGLLDVFCVTDTNDPGGLVAGKINLNTRQASTLQAVLASAYLDNYGALLPSLSSNVNANGTLSTTASANLAKALVTRTTGTLTGQGPLVNLSELVGKWLAPATPIKDPSSTYYDGTSTTNFSGFGTDITGMATFGASDYYLNNIERLREAPMRTLAAAGTTRVWNLMLDVVAQTGRFPTTAATLSDFNVEGERRYWVHIAIDRYTGKVLDEQVEEVKE